MQEFGGVAGGFAGGFAGGAAAGLPGGGITGGSVTGDSGLDMERLAMAETLGLVMARRAAQILDRHRGSIAPDAQPAAPDGAGPASGALVGAGADQFALDDAIFTAVLDATNECLGRFDPRPPADRWCDALLHLLDLARYAGEDS
jgi:hypothetical protein